ncbi:hypothetical protein PU634_10380 [Oceanimonas pelagia]|uniref:Holin n=1 Tax=Oceanimonas pelagia TaxID=3028314 RepID=A0AA50KM20_9GAMM|nr:hypothetical protein [Oceanimonas pelagia]WMC09522.1 hypothetical protein PU634_10380 [Oceanimonas pelagia]
MPDKVKDLIFNSESVFVVGLIVLGMLARHLVAEKMPSGRQLLGEAILSVITGVLVVAISSLKNLELPEMIILAGLTGVGVTHSLQRILQLLEKLKRI